MFLSKWYKINKKNNMKKTNEFRIVEQLGKFSLERKYIVEEEKTNFWSRLCPFIFKPDIIKNEIFYKLNNHGNPCNNIFNYSITYAVTFKTYNDALQFYKSLNPKYYPIEKTE
jgi:hypothetical protein